ncbi:hypothetical protein V6C03_00385 [Methyloligella sp. 2.7D]|uniref:hypothetical protein n=1 Tax=unclassified Methyloligella TaxID=2625955 RepID=UPI00157BED73|nr:hypothetical protein [Methyloligella sp. GL2]QKP76870.1 hypothetical protein HT051_05025 [Methyloligella sp. GL2]
MILGLSSGAFTELHVTISLIAIVAGLAVLTAMLSAEKPSRWTGVFLWTTVATSVTGFLFPSPGGPTPAQIVGIISLIVLALALAGFYLFRFRGPWRFIYVAAALLALYLNVFVALVQAFEKIPALNALAPTGSEPPFLIAQGLIFVAFVIFGFFAVKRFHPETA